MWKMMVIVPEGTLGYEKSAPLIGTVNLQIWPESWLGKTFRMRGREKILYRKHWLL